MTNITRILCPTDFSEFSARALRYATELAARLKAKLYVENVIEEASIYASSVRGTGADIPMLKTAYKRGIEELLNREMDESDEYEKIVVVGNPQEEILRAAEEHEIDLIVMGTHGRAGLKRLTVGSVAEQVLKKAPCPVLTLCHVAEEKIHRPLDFRTILVPVDFSEKSLQALEFALEFVLEYRSALYILHVAELTSLAEVEAQLDTFYRESYLEEIRARLAQIVPDNIKENYTIRQIAKIGIAKQEIINTAREINADLIALGIVGHGAIKSALFGSTAYQVVKEAECPVLTVSGKRR